MAEQTEVIKLSLKVDDYLLKIQAAKDQIKELDKAIKELNKDSGARKELIIEKANAEKGLKQLQAELKATEKASEEASNTSVKSFKKIALIMTAVIGAGAELKEFFKKLFRESEAFQAINIKIAEMGKAFSGLIDYYLKPFIGNLKTAKDIEFEKSLDKIRDSAIEDLASFELLARNVENLGNKLNPTATEQFRYSQAVEELKKQYPEYLSLMSTEISNHKENITLLEIKRKMLFDDIKRKVVAEEMEVAIREQIKAEQELSKIKVDTNESGYGNIGLMIKASDNLKAAQEKVIEVEKRYNTELNKTVLAEVYLANAKATAKLQATEAKIAKEQETEATQKATEEEEKYAEAIRKRDEATKARLQTALIAENADLRTIELAQQTAAAIQDVIDKYEQLKVTAPDVAVTVGEQWQSILQGVGSMRDLTLQGWSDTANVVSQQTGNIIDTFSNMYDAEINKANAAKDAKLKALEEEYANSNMSQEEYEKKRLKIEADSEKKVRKLKEKQRDMDAVKTAVSGMAASIETFKNFGGWPFGVVPAAIMTGLWMSAVAKIKSQKFAKGVKDYVVPEGYPNDSFPIFVESGERVNVETKSQQRENDRKRSFINPYVSQSVNNSLNASRPSGGAFSSGASTERIENLLSAVNANIASLDISVNVNNTSKGVGLDKLTTEITRNQERFKRAGGNLADR
jgi:hypothetical protein